MATLKYMRDRDQVVGRYTDSGGDTLHNYRFICFGNIRYQSAYCADSKYLEFYFTSSLEKLRKSRSKTFFDKFIEALSPTNIFRNAEISKVEWDDIPDEQSSEIGRASCRERV